MSSSLGRAGPRRTSVGRRLARLLQRPFADADEQLELTAGRTLSRLAREQGGEVLRRRQAQVLAYLVAHDVSLVILAPGRPRWTSAVRRCSPGRRSCWGRATRTRASPAPAGGPLRGTSPITSWTSNRSRPTSTTRTRRGPPRPAALRHGRPPRPIRVPDDVLALSDGPSATTVGSDDPVGGRAAARIADIADLVIEVEPFDDRRRQPEAGDRAPHRPSARSRRPSPRDRRLTTPSLVEWRDCVCHVCSSALTSWSPFTISHARVLVAPAARSPPRCASRHTVNDTRDDLLQCDVTSHGELVARLFADHILELHHAATAHR